MRCTRRQWPRYPLRLWYAVQAAGAGELWRWAAGRYAFSGRMQVYAKS